MSWDREREEAKFQAAMLLTQPPAVGDTTSPPSPHGAPSDTGATRDISGVQIQY